MPNMQGPLVPLSPEEKVACIIYCCDKAPYNFNTDPADPTKSCQRMGSKKHSCVLHSMRKHTESGKLTQTNKFPDEMRGNPPVKDIDGHNCIPDILINDGSGWRIIDAKFPCKPEELNPKLGVPPSKSAKKSMGVTYDSPGKPGTEMLGEKERDLYPKYPLPDPPANRKPECMTPSDAAEIKSDCDCAEIIKEKDK